MLAAPARTLRRPHVVPVAALTAAYAVLYSLFSLLQHRNFRTSNFDTVIFFQAVQSYAHFRPPITPVKGVHNWGDPSFNLLGDHFSPIMALLAPAFWVWPHVETLLVAQGVLFAASVPFVWLFTRRALGVAAAYVVAAAYGLAWGLQAALQYDVHEIMFAVPLVAAALERAQARRFGQAAVAAGALVLVKEDLTLLAAAFGGYLVLLGARRAGAALAALGLVAFVVELRVLIPFFAGGREYFYNYGYGELGDSLPAAAWFVVRHPLRTLEVLVTPGVKWHTLLWTFAPWGFLTLLSPIALLTVPVLAVRLLGDNPNWWGTSHQYSAVLMPLVTLGAVDGVARLRRRWPGRAARGLTAAWAPAVLVAALVLCTTFPFQQLTRAGMWHQSAHERAIRAAIAAVPDGATVEAHSTIGPHLADRTTVWWLDTKPRWAPWVVADTKVRWYPFDTTDQAKERVRLLLAHGYRVVADDDGVVVLHR